MSAIGALVSCAVGVNWADQPGTGVAVNSVGRRWTLHGGETLKKFFVFAIAGQLPGKNVRYYYSISMHHKYDDPPANPQTEAYNGDG